MSAEAFGTSELDGLVPHEELWRFVDGDERIGSPEDAIRLLCTLTSWVACSTSVTRFPEEPLDGFCDLCPAVSRPDSWSRFENTGAAIRAIARATRAAYEQHTPIEWKAGVTP